jgi:hypothetical protein
MSMIVTIRGAEVSTAPRVSDVVHNQGDLRH